MEIEFLRLEFHFFFLVFFGVSDHSSSSFFDGRSEDQIVPLQIRSSSSNHLFASLDRASNRSSSVFLQISKFKSVVLFWNSSLRDSRSCLKSFFFCSSSSSSSKPNKLATSSLLYYQLPSFEHKDITTIVLLFVTVSTD